MSRPNTKTVKVHHCFSPEATGLRSLWIGGEVYQKMFVVFPNASCDCQHRIARNVRDEKLESGEIFVILRYDDAKRLVPIWKEVVLARSVSSKGIPDWCVLNGSDRPVSGGLPSLGAAR